MNILATEYNLKHRALEIYVAGCERKCPGCHNPESWDFNQGMPWVDFMRSLTKKLSDPMVDQVWILGGEPLNQNYISLWELLKVIHQWEQPIMLWTSYELEVVPPFIRKLCWRIKTGCYLKDSPSIIDPVSGLTLSSGNQKVHEIG